jgi:NAD(P)-dependent dehydrogenase (short-subunit alcohol dehydrogenase family)
VGERLKDKVVLITGAGSGMGREAARLFAQEGGKIVVSDKDRERAKAASTWVNEGSGGENSFPLTADVSNEADVIAAVKATEDTYGRLDVMFANAGIVSRGGVPTVMGGEHIEFDDMELAWWNDVVATNLTGVFLCCKHAVKSMKKTGGGAIICTSSAASLMGYPSVTMYSATKAGVNGLVRNLSFDVGKYGIRVNAVLPTHGMSPNFLMPPDAPVVGQSYEEIAGPWNPTVSPIPLKVNRPPNLLDTAKVALFLASDDSAYMSGVCLPATDGGTLARVAIWFEEDLNPQPA